MSLDGPKSETDEDKISLMSVDIDGRNHGSTARTPVVKVTESKAFNINHSSLSVPNSGPIRPLSPDIVSDLSVDEYEQLHQSSESRNGSRLSLEGTKPKGWRGKIDQFWFRNKGLAFMLLAMVFAVLSVLFTCIVSRTLREMVGRSVLTRLLQNERYYPTAGGRRQQRPRHASSSHPLRSNGHYHGSRLILYVV